MGQFLIYFIAFFTTFPILASFLIYWLGRFIYQNPIAAFLKAVNWTTFFYIFSTIIIIQMIFDRDVIPLFFILILCFLSIIVLLQWKKRKEIILFRAFKQLWRACFLFFSLTYVCLVFFGIIYYMTS